ncbi:MAG TPA: alpha-L-rhamnosidase C-terminal domain-containing protein, partial [Luteolibacter sp.]
VREQPVKLMKTSRGTWFADFGNATFGNVELTLPRQSGEDRIVVHLGEALSPPDAVNRTPGGTVRYQRADVLSNPGKPVSPELEWSPPGWLKGGWVDLPEGMPQVMPFRYVELEGITGTLTPGNVTRVTWRVPFTPGASGFKSSSTTLDGVWKLSEHTIKATTFLGVYIDGDRERRPYEADALINQLGHYCLDANYEVARKTNEWFMKTPTWPTEWRLQTPILAWHDFLWSGDESFLKANYSTLVERAMLDRRTEDGWFRGFQKGKDHPEIDDIVDWPASERDGYEMHWPVKSAVIAFHYRAVVLLEKIARHLGKTADAEKFAAMAAQTKKAFNEKLWDETRGCYVDGWDPASGKVSSHASSHANFFPLSLGLVPTDRVTRTAGFLKTRGMTCSVYGAQFLLEALYDAGMADAAFALLDSVEKRSWRNMVAKTGTTMTLEAWEPSLKPNLDWNHAWGAAPANLIPRKLMGVEPLEPGFKRFRIKPQPGPLTEADLKLPTPAGSVVVKLSREGERWNASVTVPKGTMAEFHAFQPKGAKVTGSAKSRSIRVENDREVFLLAPGNWEIRAQ